MPDSVKHCIKCGRIIAEDKLICLSCGSENEMQTFRPRIVTNGDRIRNMTDAELARFLSDLQFSACDSSFVDLPPSWLEWLGKEKT